MHSSLYVHYYYYCAKAILCMPGKPRALLHTRMPLLLHWFLSIGIFPICGTCVVAAGFPLSPPAGRVLQFTNRVQIRLLGTHAVSAQQYSTIGSDVCVCGHSWAEHGSVPGKHTAARHHAISRSFPSPRLQVIVLHSVIQMYSVFWLLWSNKWIVLPVFWPWST